MAGLKAELLKIGMLAPSGTGKTTLISAIFSETQKRLEGNELRLRFYAEGSTKDWIDRAIEEFEEVARSGEIGKCKKGTQDKREFEFKVVLPLSIGDKIYKINNDVNIIDYPGGYLHDDGYDKIAEYITESNALLIPISAPLLMKWYETDVSKPEGRTVRRILKNKMEHKKVSSTIRDWITIKTKNKTHAILVFVPVKCEAYFDDNGGSVDRGEELYRAVKEFYIDDLEMTEEQKEYIRVEVQAVDTFGIVEIPELIAERNNEGKIIFPEKIIIRENSDELKPMGAAYLLGSLVKFQIERLKIENEDIYRKIQKYIEGRSFFRWFIDFLSSLIPGGQSPENMIRILLAQNKILDQVCSILTENYGSCRSRCKVFNQSSLRD